MTERPKFNLASSAQIAELCAGDGRMQVRRGWLTGPLRVVITDCWSCSAGPGRMTYASGWVRCPARGPAGSAAQDVDADADSDLKTRKRHDSRAWWS